MDTQMRALESELRRACRAGVRTPLPMVVDLATDDLSEFRVPDRGSGNPTPLGGMGPARARCTLGHGELQTRQPYGLGLQVPHCMGYEISVPHPWGRCGAAMPRADSRNS